MPRKRILILKSGKEISRVKNSQRRREGLFTCFHCSSLTFQLRKTKREFKKHDYLFVNGTCANCHIEFMLLIRKHECFTYIDYYHFMLDRYQEMNKLEKVKEKIQKRIELLEQKKEVWTKTMWNRYYEAIVKEDRLILEMISEEQLKSNKIVVKETTPEVND